MKNREYKVATMIVGVITALLVVFSQVFQYQDQQELAKQQKVKSEKHAATDDASQDDDASVVSPQPSFTVQSACTVHFSQAAILLFQVFGGEQKQTSVTHAVPRVMDKYFQTLFQILIAPNAP